METLNLNFNGTSNIIKSFCWTLSVLSWLLMLTVGWISISYLPDEMIYEYLPPLSFILKFISIWDISKYPNYDKKHDFIRTLYYAPCQMNESFLYITFIITLIFSTFGFIIYVIFCTFKKDSKIMNGMLGNISKFHFIPILSVSALFLIGIFLNDKDYDNDEEKNCNIASLVFSIIGLFSLLVISFKTQMESPWYGDIFIKKGTYGCLIALLTYNICYSVFRIGLDDMNSFDFNKKKDFRKNCGIGMSLTIGVFNLLFSYFLRDYILAAMNLLIYIGATIYFFDLPESIRDFYNEDVDGIIDIVMIVLSAAMIALILFMFKPWASK